MNKLTIFLALVFCTIAARSQTPSFGKGQLDLNAGVGFGNTMTRKLYDTSSDGNVSTLKIPSPYVSLDYGLNENLSLGGYVNYFNTEYTNGGQYETSKTTIVGARGLYHASLVSNFDTYIGVGLGLGFAKNYAHGYFFGDPDVTYNEKLLYYQALIGARYRFANTVGVFAEAGYGVALVTVGLTLKL